MGASCCQAGPMHRTGMHQKQTQSYWRGTGLLQPVWGHFCKTAPCFGQRWGGQVGTPSAANSASLQPAPALPNTPSSPCTASRNIAFPWNVFV